MTTIRMILLALFTVLLTAGCGDSGNTSDDVEGLDGGGGQVAVTDDVSMPDIVKIAVNSPDHKTLVAALTAADLVNVMSNNGPFTVFAPTDEAFAKVPKETLDMLLKPENQAALQNILYHHVQVSVYSEERLQNSESIVLFDGTPEDVTYDGETITVGGAKILGSVRAANGIVYVVDAVILPGD